MDSAKDKDTLKIQREEPRKKPIDVLMHLETPTPKDRWSSSWREGWTYTYIHDKAGLVILMTESS